MVTHMNEDRLTAGEEDTEVLSGKEHQVRPRCPDSHLAAQFCTLLFLPENRSWI